MPVPLAAEGDSPIFADCAAKIATVPVNGYSDSDKTMPRYSTKNSTKCREDAKNTTKCRERGDSPATLPLQWRMVMVTGKSRRNRSRLSNEVVG